MSRKWLRILSTLLTVAVIITALPVGAYAAEEMHYPRGLEEAGTSEFSEEEMPINAEAAEELSAEAAEEEVLAIDEVNEEEFGITNEMSGSSADYYIMGADTVIDKIGNDGYEQITEDNRELYTAFYADMQYERNGGVFFAGHDMVRLNKSGAKVYSDADMTHEATEADLTDEDKVLSVSLNALPVELCEKFKYTVTYTTSGVSDTIERSNLDPKLFIWEYRRNDDGSYDRIAIKDITMDALTIEDAGKKADLIEADHVDSVPGKINLPGGFLSDITHPFAVVLSLYDARSSADTIKAAVSEDKTAFRWNENNVFSCLEAVEMSVYNRAYYYQALYVDEPFFTDRIGNFTLSAYYYKKDDASRKLTLYSSQPYINLAAAMGGTITNFKDKTFTKLIVKNWDVPAIWTDPFTNKAYDVVLNAAYSGINIPFAENMVIKNGVQFPEDCTQIFSNRPYAVSYIKTIKIEGTAGSVGNNITNMQGMFENFDRNSVYPTYEDIDVTALDTSNVTNMKNMFKGVHLTEDKSLDVSHFNTSKVTDMSHMFSEVRIPVGMTIDLKHLDVSRVTTFEGMFDSFSAEETRDFLNKGYKPTDLDVSTLDTSSAVTMRDMFRNSYIKEINLAAADFSNVTDMSGMFADDPVITKVAFPAGINTLAVKDMGLMFAACSSLVEIDNLDKFDTSNVIDMTEMFGRGYKYRPIEIRDGEENMTTQYKANVGLDEMKLYETFDAGSDGPALKSLDLSNFNTSKVLSMAGMFDLPECTSLTLGDNFKTEQVRDMRLMFRLQQIKDPAFLKKVNIRDMRYGSEMIWLPKIETMEFGTTLDFSNVVNAYTDYSWWLSAPMVRKLDLSSAVFDRNTYGWSREMFKSMGNLCELKLPANMPVFTYKPVLPGVYTDPSGKEHDTITDSDGVIHTVIEGGNDEAYTLTAALVDPISVNIDSYYNYVYTGKSIRMNATVWPENADQHVTWSSSDTKLATVDQDGLVTGVKAGEVKIIATSAAKPSVKCEYRLDVLASGGSGQEPTPAPVSDEAYVTGVALNKGEASLYPGDVLKLSATVNPANAKDKTVTWATSNADVVTVDNTGKVTAVAAGTDASGSPAAAKAVITATAKGSESGKTMTAACTVTVLPKEIVDTDKDGNIIDPSASGVKTKDESSGEANIWVAGIDNNGYYYTGNAIKPAIHVYKGYKLLTEK
ncbi:MAG: BspA family leucine-rich repeat surface protein, partial [Lachnospiraceae bacterium]|nr:BspA family leucine-rich repeat surface protein [Lachnospiraceae bacterium]